MYSALAAVTFLVVYAACLGWVLRGRRRPPGLAGALAAALLVCVTAALLQALSIFHAVGRWELVAGNWAFVLLSAPFLKPVRWPRVPRLRGDPGPWIWLGALGLLAFISAAAYVPSNWDSMTYHMARVAHWYENHSVRSYPTNIFRQNIYPPGAEYLLLVLQVISGQDRLANFVQFGAWLLAVLAAPPLARTFGASARLARWAALLFGAAPMAVIQASSTQNDLVATVMVIAVVAGSIPFLHARSHWRTGDLNLLIIALAGALLVKPTSVIVTLPFLVWGVVSSIRSVFSPGAWRRLLPVLPFAAVVAVIVVPVLSMLHGHSKDLDSVVSNWLYAGFSEPKQRLLNLVRGVVRNLPSPLFDKLFPGHPTGCSIPGTLCLGANRVFSENSVANPGQIAFVLIVVPMGLVGLRKLPSRTRLGLIAWIVAWLTFHLTFRDNIWITRLQLPLLGLLPILLAVVRPEWIRRGPNAAVTGMLLIGIAACGAIAVVGNTYRPIDPEKLSTGANDEAYYSDIAPQTLINHNEVLRNIGRVECKRLGLLIGEDNYDYPLTWRAMRDGVEVRHVVGADNWPCAVFTIRGPPPARPDGRPWVQSRDALLYFAMSGRTLSAVAK